MRARHKRGRYFGTSAKSTCTATALVVWPVMNMPASPAIACSVRICMAMGGAQGGRYLPGAVPAAPPPPMSRIVSTRAISMPAASA